MPRLSCSEYELLLKSIEILNTSAHPDTLPARTLDAVCLLAPNVSTSFDLLDPEGNLSIKSRWSWPDDALSPEMLEVFAAHLDDHPLMEFIRNANWGVRRITDEVSIAEFKENPFYKEFLSKVGATYQVAIHARKSSGATLAGALSRLDCDFTDGEKLMLELSGPHLIQAVKNADACQKILVEKRALDSSLAELDCGAVVFNWSGKCLQKSPSTNRLFTLYFPCDKMSREGIPETVVAWMTETRLTEDHVAGLASEMTAAVGENELRLKLVRSDEAEETTLLLDERRAVSISQIEDLGLTARESEVLMLVSKGNTNPEIAELLDISPRTVHKHTENIYVKLGVESRTAAAARVYDLR